MKYGHTTRRQKEKEKKERNNKKKMATIPGCRVQRVGSHGTFSLRPTLFCLPHDAVLHLLRSPDPPCLWEWGGWRGERPSDWKTWRGRWVPPLLLGWVARCQGGHKVRVSLDQLMTATAVVHWWPMGRTLVFISIRKLWMALLTTSTRFRIQLVAVGDGVSTLLKQGFGRLSRDTRG
ncbi:hypothetical protein IE53DRAFT_76237 [Violaceomyces palustris]|uniref:Uncharacterized protein n=1 Tax=Violaceomyces palustris TaxID=1673888 RepID=A0ACD0P735_9BASI|nr:hypothetical protein IE53DRAFT_76237 [Violaceomyces palustris]